MSRRNAAAAPESRQQPTTDLKDQAKGRPSGRRRAPAQRSRSWTLTPSKGGADVQDLDPYATRSMMWTSPRPMPLRQTQRSSAGVVELRSIGDGVGVPIGEPPLRQVHAPRRVGPAARLAEYLQRVRGVGVQLAEQVVQLRQRRRPRERPPQGRPDREPLEVPPDVLAEVGTPGLLGAEPPGQQYRVPPH